MITALAVATLVLLGVGLRCRAISEEAAWGDEVLTAVCFPANNFQEYLNHVFSEDDIPRLAPLYYGVQYGWSLLFGGSLLSLRYLSVFLFAVAALQLYLLVNAIGGPSAGLWALFLFSVSLFEIYYGQEVRFYSLMNVFALMGMHGALSYSRGHTALGLCLALAGNAALVWTHIFGFTFVMALGLYMLRYVRRPRLLLLWWGTHALMALALFGWLVWLRYDIKAHSVVYHDVTAGWREIANTFVQFSGGRFSNLNPAIYMPGGISTDLIIAVFALALLGGVVIRSFFWGPERTDLRCKRGDVALLVTGFIAPLLILYAVGRLWQPCFFTRYVIYAALPLYALMGISLSSISQRKLRYGMGGILVGLFAWQVLALPRPFRADYGALTQVVMADSSEFRMVLALKPFNYRAAAYALRNTNVKTELFYGLKEIAGIAVQQATAGTSVWGVFYRWDDLAAFQERMDEAGMRTQHFESAGMPPLAIYHVTRRVSPTPPR